MCSHHRAQIITYNSEIRVCSYWAPRCYLPKRGISLRLWKPSPVQMEILLSVQLSSNLKSMQRVTSSPQQQIQNRKRIPHIEDQICVSNGCPHLAGSCHSTSRALHIYRYRWLEEINIDFKSKSMPRLNRTNQWTL